MDKQTEIKALQSLKCDTYFAAFFGEDINQMCQNISNDFPIELGCSFNTKVVALDKKIKEMEAAHKVEIEKLNAEHKAEMEKFGKDLIINNEGYVDDIYKTLYNQFGQEFIINTKFAAKQELSNDEIAYMISIMNKK